LHRDPVNSRHGPEPTVTSTNQQQDRATDVAPAEAAQDRTELARRYEDPDPVPTWDQVATEYGPRVYAMAYHLTGDRHQAEDLAQDVFVRVYRNLDKYSPGTFDGWLYRITKNLFLDGIRRRRKVRMVPLPDDDWHGSMQDGPNPEELVDRHGIDGSIEQAITELPKTFRTAVVLCDVQGMTYEEIAEATGWPMGTVRSRIHRGRRMLRSALTEG
jgi:RNA polymerase sigma-70 factor, ECF subfamily